MTEEQYKRAVEINKMISGLNEVLNEISPTNTHGLTYAHVLTYADEKGRTVPEWKLKHVADLLDRHDLMIREEIKQEIAKLVDEVKKL